jgi:hypothetical protein
VAKRKEICKTRKGYFYFCFFGLGSSVTILGVRAACQFFFLLLPSQFIFGFPCSYFDFFFSSFATRESKQQRNRRSRERGVFLLGMNVYRTQNQRADGLIEGQGEAVMPVVFFFFSPLETRQPSESENRQQQNA